MCAGARWEAAPRSGPQEHTGSCACFCPSATRRSPSSAISVAGSGRRGSPRTRAYRSNRRERARPTRDSPAPACLLGSSRTTPRRSGSRLRSVRPSPRERVPRHYAAEHRRSRSPTASVSVDLVSPGEAWAGLRRGNPEVVRHQDSGQQRTGSPQGTTHQSSYPTIVPSTMSRFRSMKSSAARVDSYRSQSMST